MNLRRAFSSVADNSCFYTADGRLHVWGSTYNQAAGADDNEGSPLSSPHPLSGLSLPGEDPNEAVDGVDFSCGQAHFVLLRRDGRVISWGGNSSGQCGVGHSKKVTVPTEVKFPEGVVIKQVRCGATFTMAISEEGRLFAWGINDRGQLGTDTHNSSPAEVLGIPPVQQVACGWCHALALTKEGELWGWGYNEDGEAGHQSRSDHSLPTKTPIEGLTKIFSGSYHSLGLTATGSLLSWGWNCYGQECTWREEGGRKEGGGKREGG
jgi:alpha-tubulin suppressor-like RCC1 family protein